jgi:transcriptional regulator with XRE-family HTH domain
MTQPAWPKAVTDGVAAEVRRWRKLRGLSTEQLSDRTAEDGHRIHRSVLANLESGRRENITVPDLVTLGRALGVPPLVLLYPVGRADDCEAFPGQRVPPWDAAKLFTGESPDTERATGDLALFRRHDQFVETWVMQDRMTIESAAEQGEVKPPTITERAISAVRDHIRDRKLLPPALPDDLAARFPAED